ncbi:MAG: chromosome segregation protein ScpA [Persephonella sp.]|nr:MAG: chromosome segregation protein ScpA [Persephonella sp.]
MKKVNKNPFQIILKLVINGEIDPWNVDIVELADKYINEIRKMEIPDFISASKILTTAVLLLKMKTEALGIEDNKKEKGKGGKRLLGIKRYYTIEELVQVLKEFITPPIEESKKERKKRSNYKRKFNKKSQNITPPPLFKATLEESIQYLMEELSNINGKIKFTDINYPDKVQSFVALLFLNYDNFINMYQEKPFGEIIVEKVNNII